jgi:alanyl aminopeptidase
MCYPALMRISSTCLLLTLCSGAVSCGTTAEVVRVDEPPPVDGPAPIEVAPLPGIRLPRDVVPSRYELALTIDPRRESFSGAADIYVTLSRSMRVIYLHGQELRVSDATIWPSEGGSHRAEWRVVDEESGVAALVFDRDVPAGRARIHIAYEAAFDRTLEGLYRVEAGGEHYAFTQMEPLAARKAFPCFDEPGWKTPFEVRITARDGDSVIANAPATSSEVTGELRRWEFARTEPLPTYLVAFAVGPFDVVEAPPIPPSDVRDRPLPFRAVAPRGQGARLQYALTHTPRIVASLERYFGIAYPYAKLDILAVPDFGAGAMENAGAITFRDNFLLISGDDAPIRQRRGFAYIMAHELAHQWFGNLVTMEWWDDLWLNEAFATWMETRTVADVFPEHSPDIAEMHTFVEAMDADALVSARQIRQPIREDGDIFNAFDSITYSKGASVLSMFERWIGADTFRRGVQSYLAEHRHGSATSADLFTALSAQAQRDVGAPFGTFIDQRGAPLVEAAPSCDAGRGRLTLRQSRYAPLGSRATGEARWQIPICVRYGVGRAAHRECTLLTEQESTIDLSAGCPAWVLPNAEGGGYYRFSMPAADLVALARAPLTPRETIAYAEAIGASFEAGRISYADALTAMQPLAASQDRHIARAPMGLYELAIRHLLTTEAQARARARASRTYAPHARRLGWRPRPNETPDVALMRAEVLSFLAFTAEDAGVRAEALRRGRAYVGFGGDGAIHPEAVPVDLASLSLRVAAEEGDAAFFDHLLGLFVAQTEPVVRNTLLGALSSVDAPELRARALDLALDPRLRVNEVDAPLYIQAYDPEGRDIAWAWLRAHYDAVAARVGPTGAGYSPYLAGGFCEAARVEEVRAFFTPHMESTQGGARNLEATIETIELCAARREHARATVEQAFAR